MKRRVMIPRYYSLGFLCYLTACSPVIDHGAYLREGGRTLSNLASDTYNAITGNESDSSAPNVAQGPAPRNESYDDPYGETPVDTIPAPHSQMSGYQSDYGAGQYGVESYDSHGRAIKPPAQSPAAPATVPENPEVALPPVLDEPSPLPAYKAGLQASALQKPRANAGAENSPVQGWTAIPAPEIPAKKPDKRPATQAVKNNSAPSIQPKVKPATSLEETPSTASNPSALMDDLRSQIRQKSTGSTKDASTIYSP